jgi:hypothetical protein
LGLVSCEPSICFPSLHVDCVGLLTGCVGSTFVLERLIFKLICLLLVLLDHRTLGPIYDHYANQN